jgi:hypothetical protein
MSAKPQPDARTAKLTDVDPDDNNPNRHRNREPGTLDREGRIVASRRRSAVKIQVSSSWVQTMSQQLGFREQGDKNSDVLLAGSQNSSQIADGIIDLMVEPVAFASLAQPLLIRKRRHEDHRAHFDCVTLCPTGETVE